MAEISRTIEPLEVQGHAGGALLRSVVIALIAFLSLVDLFATQAILPSLTKHYGVTPAAISLVKCERDMYGSCQQSDGMTPRYASAAALMILFSLKNISASLHQAAPNVPSERSAARTGPSPKTCAPRNLPVASNRYKRPWDDPTTTLSGLAAKKLAVGPMLLISRVTVIPPPEVPPPATPFRIFCWAVRSSRSRKREVRGGTTGLTTSARTFRTISAPRALP